MATIYFWSVISWIFLIASFYFSYKKDYIRATYCICGSLFFKITVLTFSITLLFQNSNEESQNLMKLVEVISELTEIVDK